MQPGATAFIRSCAGSAVRAYVGEPLAQEATALSGLDLLWARADGGRRWSLPCAAPAPARLEPVRSDAEIRVKFWRRVSDAGFVHILSHVVAFPALSIAEW
jgi:hypothetical protein